MIRKTALFIYDVFLSPLPGGRLSYIKVFYLRCLGWEIDKSVVIAPHVSFTGRGMLQIGKNAIIYPRARFECDSKIVIGQDVEINTGTLVSANGSAVLTIEDSCHIAHGVSLKCSEHNIDLALSHGSIAGESVFRDITIGKGFWICAGVIVIPGVKIGRYNVVAAGAVVIGSSPDCVLLAGVPATVKKQYTINASKEVI